MNFFDFDDATNGIVVGRNVWIFLVFWIPLTVLTYAAYILLRWANAKIDGKVFDWPWTQARNIWKSWMATRALNISKV